MPEKDKKSRRKFLSLGLLAGTGLVTGTAKADVPTESGETVKMLTPDGKLVEVDKRLLKSAGKRQKVSNKDILDWVDPAGKA
jgi:hypothetical protein